MGCSGCIEVQDGRVGRANGSREGAPDDGLRVPTLGTTISLLMVGTEQVRLCLTLPKSDLC